MNEDNLFIQQCSTLHVTILICKLQLLVLKLKVWKRGVHFINMHIYYSYICENASHTTHVFILAYLYANVTSKACKYI